MFDYFFKRPANHPVPTQTSMRETAVEAPQSRDKDIALQQAKALNGQESAAVEFILQCQFADARLIAAENVRTREMLERVLPPMRKADRRVAKLIQERLDALAAGQQREQLAQQCVDKAQKLAGERVLLPNLVADLDRAWKLVGMPSQGIVAAFEEIRSSLRARLEAQAQLQRAAIDAIEHLRELAERASGMTPTDAAAALEKIEQDMAQYLELPEAPSLPKNLLSEFSAQCSALKSLLGSLADVQEAMQARQRMLSWEEEKSIADLNEITLRKAWSALPTLSDDAASHALQLRFDTLLQRVIGLQPKEVSQTKPVVDKDRSRNVADALDSMEKALQEGAVRAAIEIDKQLRSPELQGVRLSAGQSAQQAKLRGELTHLQGWAKWGGNISREELLRAAEELPGKSLQAMELAKKVGGLRDRWKSLDVSAGPSSKDLWERFDAACTLAYAPAAAHFKKLAEERHANMQKAEAIVAEVKQFALGSDCTGENASAANWKAIANFCAQTRQTWHRLGNIDRKDKKRLDNEFEQSMRILKEPLEQQLQAEVIVRESLIAETLALNPTDRATLDAIRGLQERWQQRAKALPLERKIEQALWQKFRSACDSLFTKRKEVAAGADADRKRHLSEKESLCEKLEASMHEPASVIVKILRDAKDAWSKIGPVPRAQESQIESRLHSATSKMQAQIDNAKRIAADKEMNALRDKMRLCMALERAIVDQTDAAQTNLDQWQALPASSGDVERILRVRFENGLQALQSKDGQYRANLENNRSVLLQGLLRFEILNAMESPAEMARERLHMQVEVLQSTLKAGATANKQDMLKELCKLAAAMDQATAQRVELLIGRLKNAA